MWNSPLKTQMAFIFPQAYGLIERSWTYFQWNIFAKWWILKGTNRNQSQSRMVKVIKCQGLF